MPPVGHLPLCGVRTRLIFGHYERQVSGTMSMRREGLEATAVLGVTGSDGYSR